MTAARHRSRPRETAVLRRLEPLMWLSWLVLLVCLAGLGYGVYSLIATGIKAAQP